MNKRRTTAQNVAAVESFLNAGIGVTAGFVPGFPGDTREAFMRSAIVLRDLQERFPGRLEIHVEPFLVQPNAPLYHKLDQMGLSARSWDEAYLDTAPDFRHISEKVLCSVEGPSQGIERLGRHNLVRTLKSDEPIHKDYSFENGAEEFLTVHAFAFDHLATWWHLGRKKSPCGHTYAVLLTERETRELTVLQEEHPLTEPGLTALTPILDRIEAAHIVPPSRVEPRIVRSVFRRALEDGCTYAISPFVVARRMGSTEGSQVLIANLSSVRHFRRSAVVGSVLSFVEEAPRTAEELRKRARELGSSVRRLRNMVADLLETGTLVVCEASDQPITCASVAKGERDAPDARGVGQVICAGPAQSTS
jgi:hypothetical protein